MPSAPAPVRCGARRRTALHGMCLHIWRTVHRGSLELPSPTRHRVGSVHSFTHKSRIYRMERTHDSRLERLPVRRGPTAPDRPNGQERSPTAERLGCTGAGSGRGGLGPKILAKTVTCGVLRGAAPSSSIAYRALYAYTLRSTLAKVTVLVLPLPAQPF